MTKNVLYVGADNETGVVNKQAICDIVSESFQGFTLYDTVGYWQGAPESSVAVTIFTEDYEQVKQTAARLRDSLAQDAVLVENSVGVGELV